MMNPEKLIEDLFDDKNLADYKLRGFTEDFLVRLVLPDNNPGGIYSGVFSDVSTKYTNFFGKITNVATLDAISQGLTIAMENAKKAAIDQIIKLEGLVTFKFGKTGQTYQEFYPHGLSEYHNADLPELSTLLQRFLTAASTHLNVTNPGDVSDTGTLFGNFNSTRSAQLSIQGQVESGTTGKRTDRKALTLGLTTAMLTIALNNLENADNYNNYYNPSYLPLSDKQVSISGIIAASSIITAVNEGLITQSSNLRFYNKGTEALIVSISDQPATIHPQYQVSIQPGTDIAYTETLPVFEKYYINIQNQHATANGKWKVVVS